MQSQHLAIPIDMYETFKLMQSAFPQAMAAQIKFENDQIIISGSYHSEVSQILRVLNKYNMIDANFGADTVTIVRCDFALLDQLPIKWHSSILIESAIQLLFQERESIATADILEIVKDKTYSVYRFFGEKIDTLPGYLPTVRRLLGRSNSE